MSLRYVRWEIPPPLFLLLLVSHPIQGGAAAPNAPDRQIEERDLRIGALAVRVLPQQPRHQERGLPRQAVVQRGRRARAAAHQ